MKKKMLFTIFTILVLLCSCAPQSQLVPTQDVYTPAVEAFSASQQCTKLCWLGIQPEETEYEDVIQIINQSDKTYLEIAKSRTDTIELYWFLEKTKTFGTPVEISLSKGVVEKIEFKRLLLFTTSDFVDILGQPEQIRLIAHTGLHGEEYIVYQLYYLERKISLQAKTTTDYGPGPNDYVERLIINHTVEDSYWQSWLGYGHIDEYLNLTIPTPTTHQ